MRNLLLSLVVVGLLAAPSMAFIDVQLVPAKSSIGIGEATTVAVQFKVTSSPARGLGIVAGNISSNDFAGVTGLTFDSVMNNTVSPSQLGAAAGAGWAGLAATQATPNQASYANGVWQTAFTLNVVGVTAGNAVLSFQNATVLTPGGTPRQTQSLSLGGIPATFDRVVNASTGGAITVTPEPITMALLALGGLVVARRRSH